MNTEGILQGIADRSIQRFVQRFLEKHAGMIVDDTTGDLVRARMSYWRTLFSSAINNDWKPGKTLVTMFEEAKVSGVITADLGTSAGSLQPSGQQPRSQTGLDFLDEYLPDNK